MGNRIMLFYPFNLSKSWNLNFKQAFQNRLLKQN